MAGFSDGDGELAGWKQIAAYLRVSVRTAQKLEKEQGLPVRRGFGMKAPVFAIEAELDAWKGSRVTPPLDPVPPEPIRTREDRVKEIPARSASDLPSRRRWLEYCVAGTLPLISAGAGVAIFRSLSHARSGPPCSWRVNGPIFRVFDANGRELWTHTFPEDVRAEWSLCTFADLDGGGNAKETLFAYSADRSYPNSSLNCFNSDGSRRWEFTPGKTVTDNLGRQFTPPYATRAVQILRRAGDRRGSVVVSSVHNYSFPSQLAIADGETGELTAEYWHRGHLCHLAVADLDGNGEPEILAGGVNDAPEYKQATLLLFDRRALAGATPHPGGGSYFEGIRPVSARRTIFFPKSVLSETQEFNRVRGISVEPKRVVVDVAEGISEQDTPSVIYEFDYDLRLCNVVLTDEFQNRLRQLQAGRRVPVESPEAMVERLKSELRVL